MSQERIRAALVEAFAPGEVEVIDDSAAHVGHAGAREGGHYSVRIVSARFAGRPNLERHRLVYDALAPFMGRGGIHALAIVARAPGEPL
ncbi:MAG TPA: BolA family protein [Steroidobacteraceae bacterium]|nr:BolA family protein [Steroidobacteraceae bacterium]